MELNRLDNILYKYYYNKIWNTKLLTKYIMKASIFLKKNNFPKNKFKFKSKNYR